MANYDKTIKKLAKVKAKMSPHKHFDEMSRANADLRVLNRRNQNTKNFVEYKASQIVRCQNRIRQETLSSKFKQFSAIARDVERTNENSNTIQS